MRFYDRLREGTWDAPEEFHPQWETIRPYLDEWIADAQVIAIDEAEAYYRKTTPEDERWDAKDFPNVAPPFEVFFLDARKWGVLIAALQIPDEELRQVGVHWALAAYLFTEPRKWKPRLMGGGSLYVAKDGSALNAYEFEFDHGTVVEAEKDKDEPWFPIRFFDFTGRAERGEGLEMYESPLFDMFPPALFALSLMHCKNVEVVERKPNPKQARSFAKRHGRPLARFHTLEIEPMRRILEDAGGASQTGLKRALHICRGHFKDYRERGLFGRRHGIYWWDPQLRGNVREGMVLKDYEVEEPQATA